MNKTNVEKKLVIIEGSGTIAELGYISAPILIPQRFPIDLIARMVSNGRKVYEINPADRTQKIKLTVANCRKPNFDTAVQTEAAAKPAPTKVPATPTSKTNNTPNKESNKQSNPAKNVAPENPKDAKETTKSADAKVETPANDFTAK